MSKSKDVPEDIDLEQVNGYDEMMEAKDEEAPDEYWDRFFEDDPETFITFIKK